MTPPRFDSDEAAMRHALSLAVRGLGHVEPNPPVGCVVVTAEGQLLGEGWHQKYGGPHAEVHTLAAAGDSRGATAVVTLEPCCHHGKTGPCSQALIAAGIRRVVIGISDPAPHVAGGGIEELRRAGVEVEVGVLQDEAARLIAPFRKLVTRQRPWLHAKWAMTLDGCMASRTRHSQWISSATSRETVHALRGRVDAVLVGSGTARDDNPLLTARPPGPRTATRVVVSARGALAVDSQLVQTARDGGPVLLATTELAPAAHLRQLQAAGVEPLVLPYAAQPEAGSPDSTASPRVCLAALLDELGRRRMTHILAEGGSGLLGSLHDAGEIDEVHVFIAPKLLGGDTALGPVGGVGRARVPSSADLDWYEVHRSGDDVYLHGTLRSAESPS